MRHDTKFIHTNIHVNLTAHLSWHETVKAQGNRRDILCITCKQAATDFSSSCFSPSSHTHGTDWASLCHNGLNLTTPDYLTLKTWPVNLLALPIFWCFYSPSLICTYITAWWVIFFLHCTCLDCYPLWRWITQHPFILRIISKNIFLSCPIERVCVCLCICAHVCTCCWFVCCCFVCVCTVVCVCVCWYC